MMGPDGTPAEPSVGAFGRWLLQERELRGLGRDEVARLTKLGPAIIEALESGDPGRMPPRAYVQGYLRAYAAAVGLARPLPLKAGLIVLVALVLAALAALALFGSPKREPLKLERPRAVERGPYLPAPGR